MFLKNINHSSNFIKNTRNQEYKNYIYENEDDN